MIFVKVGPYTYAQAFCQAWPSMREGGDLHESQPFIEKLRLRQFLTTSGPSILSLKNGSGSKFYTGKWYREVCSSKLKLFHDVKLAITSL